MTRSNKIMALGAIFVAPFALFWVLTALTAGIIKTEAVFQDNLFWFLTIVWWAVMGYFLIEGDFDDYLDF